MAVSGLDVWVATTTTQNQLLISAFLASNNPKDPTINLLSDSSYFLEILGGIENVPSSWHEQGFDKALGIRVLELRYQ